jgi:hypothetical protein
MKGNVVPRKLRLCRYVSERAIFSSPQYAPQYVASVSIDFDTPPGSRRGLATVRVQNFGPSSSPPPLCPRRRRQSLLTRAGGRQSRADGGSPMSSPGTAPRSPACISIEDRRPGPCDGSLGTSSASDLDSHLPPPSSRTEPDPNHPAAGVIVISPTVHRPSDIPAKEPIGTQDARSASRPQRYERTNERSKLRRRSVGQLLLLLMALLNPLPRHTGDDN